MGTATLLPEAARSYAEHVLAAAGFDAEDAALTADLLLEASLRGIDSHGVVTLLPVFAEQGTLGVGREGTAPVRTGGAGSVAHVEGRGASGPRTLRLALAAATELARTHGVGVCAASEVGYAGALFWSVLPAAAEGLIALCTMAAAACVAPAGGAEPLHGTNPIAIAVPCEPDPIVLDMRTNEFRLADYWRSLSSGEPLPPGLISAEGTPVTDAGELEGGVFTKAVYLPLAGAKGYGLALVVDVLASALTGTPIGLEIDLDTENDRLGAFLLVIDPAAFGPPERFASAVRRLGEQAHAIAPLDPARPVLLPGERGAAERRRRLAEGIPVDLVLWERMEGRLAGLGLVPPPQPFQIRQAAPS